MADPHQVAYRRQAATLARIGRALEHSAVPKVEVRIPRNLARAAVQAWEYDDEGEVASGETPEERIERHRAGALALIGLAIQERGVADGDDVVVSLDANLIGDSMNAADDLLDPT